MATQRQIIAILTVIGSISALGFAVYNLYYAMKYPNGVTAKR